MGFISHRVERSDLEVGDHIYTWRAPVFVYSHHGIYVGGDNVVHFSVDNSFHSSCTSTCNSSSSSANGGSRVVITSLNCFLGKGSLRRFQYGVSAVAFMAKVRGGTCTTAKSDPPQEVIRRAMYLLQNGFGNYHLLTNNCEVFALYCKTGLVIDRRLGTCGQAATALSIPASASTSSLTVVMYQNAAKAIGFVLRHLRQIVWPAEVSGAAAVSVPAIVVAVVGTIVGVHIARYVSDVGVRNDVVKVNAEDLAAFRTNLPILHHYLHEQLIPCFLSSAICYRIGFF